MIQSFRDCQSNLTGAKYDGFKDFTRDIQINWRSNKLLLSEKSGGFKTHAEMPVTSFERGAAYNEAEVEQCLGVIRASIAGLE